MLRLAFFKRPFQTVQSKAAEISGSENKHNLRWAYWSTDYCLELKFIDILGEISEIDGFILKADRVTIIFQQ